MIPERLRMLRAEMAKRNIDIYVVPTADFHESEYVGEHFKARKYITGFSGSAGVSVITMTEAGLWTDGRYFLQAGKQLSGTGVDLYKMGEEGVPTVTEFLRSKLPEGGTLGFDGRVINNTLGEELLAIAGERGGKLHTDEDLIDLIWEERPPLSCEPARILGMEYAGVSVTDKLAAVRAVMAEKGASIHLLTSLYDIAWLLNIRGNDIHCVPVVLSYLVLTERECLWFVQEKALSGDVRSYLRDNGISVRPYDDFYGYVAAIPAGESLLLDSRTVNYRVCSSIGRDVYVINSVNPTVLMRSVKNETEQRNIRSAHVKDAVAVCKFIYWLKKNIGKLPMTEVSVTGVLEGLRAEQEGFLGISFDTICGYAHHGAIIHYTANAESDIPLEPRGLLLVDSGGHYNEGTTDITRTIALGPCTEEEKRDFTRVCRSNINLAAARFLYGCSGVNLDIIARSPLWEAELDYKHGTGHGVGYILNVHEGPNGFRWKQSPERSEGSVLEEGMVTTDEPGIYIEGKYGIRTESELLCRKGTKNEFGQFMEFENLTYVPIDRDALLPEEMTCTEKKRLNAYHENVYATIAPLLNEEERAWLREATRPIG